MSSVGKTPARLRRKKRVRKKIRGTRSKPRLCVFRSAKHIYAQLIDDATGQTLAEASSLSKELRLKLAGKGSNKEGAAMVGSAIAKNALDKGIKKVVFDRNGFLYHGRVKALSDGAREGGLKY